MEKRKSNTVVTRLMKYWYGFFSSRRQASNARLCSPLVCLPSRWREFLKLERWCWQSRYTAKEWRDVVKWNLKLSWIFSIFFLSVCLSVYLSIWWTWCVLVPIYLRSSCSFSEDAVLCLVIHLWSKHGRKSWSFLFSVPVGVRRGTQTTGFTQINLNSWNTFVVASVSELRSEKREKGVSVVWERDGRSNFKV